VLSGVQPGDRIVIDGADKLREGAKVVVRTEADANNPAAGTPPPAGAKAADKGADGDKAGKKKRRSDGDQKQSEPKQDEPKQ
jgi:membrane fusion protein, multidrug efflux system